MYASVSRWRTPAALMKVREAIEAFFARTMAARAQLSIDQGELKLTK
jgi:hypothetical protein